MGNSVCALAAESVDEIMRPLPIEQVARGPHFVLGLSIIRGAATPVVELAALLGDAAPVAPLDDAAARFVSLRVGARRVALRVDAVLGIRTLTDALLSDLPPLLREQAAASIAQVGTLDAELLVVLRSAQLLPEEMWSALEVGTP